MEEQKNAERVSVPAGSLPPIGDLLSSAWKVFVERWQLYVSLMIIIAVLQAVTGYVMPASGTNDALWSIQGETVLTAADAVVLLVVVIVSIFTQSAVYYAIINREKTMAFQDAVRNGIKMVVPFFIASFLAGLASLVGLVFLIIPGVLFYIWFMFSGYVVFKEGKTGVEALKRSKELVAGHWWAIFWRFIFFAIGAGIVSGILGIIPLVGPLLTTLIITPFSVIYVALIYEHRLKHSTK